VDVDRYLQRIQHGGPTDPTLPTLTALHLAHLHSVPFENLDIHLQRPIVVDEAAFFRKIVDDGRGGFCYELNGLFAWLLRQLGFQVTLLSGRVVNRGVAGPEFDHLTLQVDLPDGRWLADVGFGRSFREPLSLDTGAESEAEGAHYRVVPGAPDWRVEYRLPEKASEPEYFFTLTPRPLSAFAEMCRFHQSAPGSPFPRKRMCTLAIPDGRITFLNGTFISQRAGVRTERPLEDAEIAPLLRDRFGVHLSDDDVRGWSRPPAPRA
jgi:N-hydroxyarylamine O-acetyltransferase